MRDFVQLGSAPYREIPAQPGEANYRVNAIRDCQAYVQAIRNNPGYEPPGAMLAYWRFPTDSGEMYYEVICYYDRALAASVQYASRCEKNAPTTWQDGGVRPPPKLSQAKRSRS